MGSQPAAPAVPRAPAAFTPASSGMSIRVFSGATKRSETVPLPETPSPPP